MILTPSKHLQQPYLISPDWWKRALLVTGIVKYYVIQRISSDSSPASIIYVE